MDQPQQTPHGQTRPPPQHTKHTKAHTSMRTPHLLLGDVHGLGVVPRQDELLEEGRTRDVAALPDVEELEAVLGHHQVLQPGQPHLRPPRPGGPRGGGGGHLGDGRDVVGRGAAAAADHVDHVLLHEDGVVAGHVGGRVVVAAHGVGQAGVGIG